MYLERLAFNKFKIFLTMDDLSERGLAQEDIWKDSLEWHQLFDDLLEKTSIVCGISIEGSVTVELFSVQTQGMIMIVTLDDPGEDPTFNDVVFDLQSAAYENKEKIFEFVDFEDIIRLSKRLQLIQFTGGSLYNMDNKYYLYIKESSFADDGKLEANLAEFGQLSAENIYHLHEYGKLLIKNKAVETLVHYFK